ncbi:helix-turn-helix domain-containing protein [Pseudomonas sp. MT3]
MNFGERLKEERVRLGYNQGDFAAIGGVAKTSQFNYEKAERCPDVAYLAAVAAVGVDVLYVVTGVRTPSAADSLTEDEAKLIGLYRGMGQDNRETIIRVSEAFAIIG